MNNFIEKRYLHYFDWFLLFLIFVIPICGFLVLYSAGLNPGGRYVELPFVDLKIESIPLVKQFIFWLIGWCALLIALWLSPALIERFSYPFYLVSLGLLVLVLFIGNVVNGSRRWIDLGVVNLQPAELMKLAVVVCLAKYLSNLANKKSLSFKDCLVPLVVILVPMLLIMRQPDLGTALVVGASGGAVVIFYGIKLRVVFTTLLLAGILAYPIWDHLHDYQKKRVAVLFDSNIDPLGSGYHINQSKIALGAGGVWGRGFLRGTQSQLEFLPEHTTDFIFSVLGEEFGFVGTVFVLFLYLLLFLKMLRNIHRAREPFPLLVMAGIFGFILFHVLTNIGMVIGLFPVVGIPLPLFSYGGSALLLTMFSLGIVLSFTMRRLERR